MSQDLADGRCRGDRIRTIARPPYPPHRLLIVVVDNLGFALGKLYVEEHFPPKAKAEIEAMVEKLALAPPPTST